MLMLPSGDYVNTLSRIDILNIAYFNWLPHQSQIQNQVVARKWVGGSGWRDAPGWVGRTAGPGLKSHGIHSLGV